MKFARIIAAALTGAMLFMAFPIPAAAATEPQQDEAGGRDRPLSDTVNKRCKAIFSKYGWDMSKINFMDNHDCIVYYNDITTAEAKRVNKGTGLPGASSPDAGYVVYARTTMDIDGLRLAKTDKPELIFVVRFSSRDMESILEAAIRVSPSGGWPRWFYSPNSKKADITKDVKAWYPKNHAVAKNAAQHVGFFGGYRPEDEAITKIFTDFYGKTKWKNVKMNVYQVSTFSSQAAPYFSAAECKVILNQCIKDGITSATLYDDSSYGLQYGIAYFFYSESAFKTTNGNRFYIDFCMTSEYDQTQQRMVLGMAWLVVKPISADAKKAYPRKIFPVAARTNDIFAYVDAQVK